MSFLESLRRLLGQRPAAGESHLHSSPAQASSTTPEGSAAGSLEAFLEDRFAECFAKSVAAAGSDPIMNALLQAIRPAVQNNLGLMAAKVRQTLEDGAHHSWSTVAHDADLFLEASVLPCPGSSAKSFLQSRLAGGYKEFAFKILQTPPAAMARMAGADVMVHLIFCVDQSCRHLSLFWGVLPMEACGSPRCPRPFMPDELT